MHILRFDSLESTNKYCERLDLRQVEAFTVVWALEQHGGVGQRGNRWHSAPGENLTFSIVMHPQGIEAARQYGLTMQCATAIASWLEQRLADDGRSDPTGAKAFNDGCAEKVSIKWPNDIYVGDRKICGTLITCTLKGGMVEDAVCGIGLNVNETDFPEELPNAVSLAQLTGRRYDLEPLLRSLCEAIEAERAEGVEERYLKRLYQRGVEAHYLYKGTPIVATIEGVNSYGHLLLTTSGGEAISCQLKELVFCQPRTETASQRMM
ncbi:MAG: biotin--[acetyl-CoA-carboxylase] ligase [Bacteroidales bacterium]|nr:biotin--[acetyl-CoA-carboxylase] ligase [Bacteroidales bacterium]